MPEIPEIETVRRHLERTVLRQAITSVIVNREKAINIPSDQFQSTIKSQYIASVQRRAKQLILILSNNTSIVIHFMLEGNMHLFKANEEMDKKPSVLLGFENGDRLGIFKINLGYVHLATTTNLCEMSELDNLGPEPLLPEFTENKFINMLEERKGMIKPLLMDQNFIAGIGNVYSNEILFCSCIKPTRKIKQIFTAEKKILFGCIKEILQRAVDLGGVYEEQFSSDDEITGGFTSQLQVAYRTGKPCYVCGKAIITKRVGGRNAFYCTECQH